MTQFWIKRFLSVIPMIFGVLFISMSLLHIIPGDPVEQMLGEQASHEDKQKLREQLGLNLSFKENVKKTFTNVLHFDLGKSIVTGEPVVKAIYDKLAKTASLTLVAMILSILIGVTIGVLAAQYQNRSIDHFAMFYGLLGMSIPAYVSAPLLILLFSLQLDLLPVGDMEDPLSILLPALSLAIPLSAILTRMTRASMMEVLNEDYIRTARSKGVSDNQVFFRHALKNALMPVITLIGLQFGALLTGAVVVETIFDWPGLGTLLYSSLMKRDYPVIQGCLILMSFIYVAATFITEIFYGVVNPRVRT